MERVRLNIKADYIADTLGIMGADSHSLKVETNGSGGAKNILTEDEIRSAEGIIVAADKQVETERFSGKPVLFVPVAEGMPLTELNFREPADAVEVPAGHVALSVPIGDDQGIATSMDAGATLAAYEVSETGVRLLADNLQVLLGPQGSSGMLSSGSVTVAVEPAEVAPILAASEEGSLRLALPGDGALELSQEAPTAPSEVPAEDGGGAEGA